MESDQGSKNKMSLIEFEKNKNTSKNISAKTEPTENKLRKEMA